jgi:hypothetical protein
MRKPIINWDVPVHPMARHSGENKVPRVNLQLDEQGRVETFDIQRNVYQWLKIIR